MSTLSVPLAPAAIVVFGITGDLAKRKLLPALYHLQHDGLLPKYLSIIGVTRSGTTVEATLSNIRDCVQTEGESCDEQILKTLGESMRIVTMDLAQQEEYVRLRQILDEYEQQIGLCVNRLFYLAVPSQTFGPIAEHLGRAGLHEGCSHQVGESRLMIEKPFGYDLKSARELASTLAQYFSEQQVYRVDHYLAKETTQNIMTFRFHNPLFRAVWDSSTVSAIMITAAESIDIEGRVAFYEQTGALRDFVQSHLLQLMALVAMEEPDSLEADEIHARKLALLKAVKPIAPDQVATQAVRAQYDGYLEDVGNHTSLTETYAALRLQIDTPRWQGVPVLLRSGKALKQKVTEITLVYGDSPQQNLLTLRIQPNEGISLELQAKKPGFDEETELVQMDFCYEKHGEGLHPDAYERVLVDALRGDKTLFTTSDEVIAAWEIVDHVSHAWSMTKQGMESYERDSWGPEGADKLATTANTNWMSHRLKVCQAHDLPPTARVNKSKEIV